MTETQSRQHPARRVWPESDRPTEQVKLRLSPEAASALRLSAEARCLSHSAYVTSLVLAQHRTDKGEGAGPSEIGLLEIIRLTYALDQIPTEVRRLRAELGRQGGLLKYLAETTPITARHDAELSEALRSVIATAEAADVAVDVLQDATATARRDLERAGMILTAREHPEAFERRGLRAYFES